MTLNVYAFILFLLYLQCKWWLRECFTLFSVLSSDIVSSLIKYKVKWFILGLKKKNCLVKYFRCVKCFRNALEDVMIGAQSGSTYDLDWLLDYARHKFNQICITKFEMDDLDETGIEMLAAFPAQTMKPGCECTSTGSTSRSEIWALRSEIRAVGIT